MKIQINHRILVMIAAVLAATAAAGVYAQPQSQQPRNVAGTWSGAVDAMGQRLEVVVQITQTSSRLSGTIDIPQQMARGIPLEGLSLEGDRIRFTIAGVPGSPTFEGRIDAADSIPGTFTQHGQRMAFELKRGAVAAPKRPQEPKPPFPYHVEDVVVSTGPVRLAGTLSKPHGDGPFAAVILLTGSGPQNRDQEVFNHKPFAVIADYLTRSGFAVLRCDDRGVGGSTGNLANVTNQAFVQDALAKVTFLKQRKDVNRIGLLGHSEGGLTAARAAAASRDVAFLIMLAGPGVNGRDTLVEQNRRIFRAAGVPEHAVQLVGERAAALFDAVIEKRPRREVMDRFIALADAQSTGAGQGASDRNELERAARDGVNDLFTPWFREFLTTDPADYLRRVRVPTLALFGDLDVQVSSEQNAPVVEKALADARNGDATVRTLSGLNHLFQPAKSGSVEEYYEIETTIDPSALRLIEGWLVERFVQR